MALTQDQRIQISLELLDLPLKIAGAQNAKLKLAELKLDLLSQDESLKLFFDKYNNITNYYQNEYRWLDGTTYTTLIEQDILDAAQKFGGNKFFPTDGSWLNFKPKLHNSALGLPTSNSPDNEIDVLNEFFYSPSDLIDLLINGQASVVPDDVLDGTSYSGGSATLTVTTGGQTIGNLLLLDDGVDSALVRVTAVNSLNIDVEEVIAPVSSVSSTGDVIEDIDGFTNTERNTLTSTIGQNVLNELTNFIIQSILDWEASLDNQYSEVSLNEDSRSPQDSEILAAIADLANAQFIIDTWQALPNTGTLGTDSKFTDNNLVSITDEISDRISFIPTRTSQIDVALDTVNQNPDGTFSGAGIYYQRFNTVDLRINLAGGPLTEYYEKGVADSALDQIIETNENKQTTFESELTVSALSSNGTGTNIIEVEDASGFSTSDSVFVVADGETELSGIITDITLNTVTLDFVVSSLYTTSKKARLYKQL